MPAKTKPIPFKSRTQPSFLPAEEVRFAHAYYIMASDVVSLLAVSPPEDPEDVRAIARWTKDIMAMASQALGTIKAQCPEAHEVMVAKE